MKARLFLLFLLTLSPLALYGQSFAPVLSFIQHKSDIREGGCDLFEYDGRSILIAVAPVAVGSKSELNCKTVGSAKAKRNLLSFVNGSEITSCTSLVTSETEEGTLSGVRVKSSQVFTESIRETVLGEINMTVPLGGWYSEDRSVYFFAIYKIIE